MRISEYTRLSTKCVQGWYGMSDWLDLISTCTIAIQKMRQLYSIRT